VGGLTADDDRVAGVAVPPHVGISGDSRKRDPDVQTGLADYFERIAPEDRHAYVHTLEGVDDMPAHVRSVLAGVNLSIPVINGRLALGSWQGVHVFERRRSPHVRSRAVHLIGSDPVEWVSMNQGDRT